MKKIKRIQKRSIKIILKFIKYRRIKKLAIAIYDHGRDNIKFSFTETLSITRGIESNNFKTLPQPNIFQTSIPGLIYI